MEPYSHISLPGYTSWHIGDKYLTQVLISNNIKYNVFINDNFLQVTINNTTYNFSYFPPKNIKTNLKNNLFADFNTISNPKLINHEFKRFLDSKLQQGFISHDISPISFSEEWKKVSDHPALIFTFNFTNVPIKTIVNDITKPSTWKPNQFLNSKNSLENHIQSFDQDNYHKMLKIHKEKPYQYLDNNTLKFYIELLKLEKPRNKKPISIPQELLKILDIHNTNNNIKQLIKGSKTPDVFGFTTKSFQNDDSTINWSIILDSLNQNISKIYFLRKDQSKPLSGENSRPIAIQPASIKLLERATINITHKVMESYLFKEPQFGFRKNSSTLKAFMNLTLKYKHIKSLLSLDLKKAYDNINFHILYLALSDATPPHLWPIIKFQLDLMTNQLIYLNGETYDRNKGLPQGSALSPLFFNIYLSYLFKNMAKNIYEKIFMFADDILIVNPTNYDIEELTSRLNYGNLQINKKKTYFSSYLYNEPFMDFHFKKQIRWLGWLISINENQELTTTTPELHSCVPWKLANFLPMNIKINIISQYFMSKAYYHLSILKLNKLDKEATSFARKILLTTKKFTGLYYLGYRDLSVLGIDPKGLLIPETAKNPRGDFDEGIFHINSNKIKFPFLVYFRKLNSNYYRLDKKQHLKMLVNSNFFRHIRHKLNIPTPQFLYSLIANNWKNIYNTNSYSELLEEVVKSNESSTILSFINKQSVDIPPNCFLPHYI